MVYHVHKSSGSVNDQRTVAQLLNFVPNGEYVITVETKQQWNRRQGRTNDQNALMWAYFRDAAKVLNDYTGDTYWDSRRLHDYLCNMWRVDDITPEGEVWSKPMRTSQLSKAKMTEFLKRVQAWLATEYGCDVPLPDDDNYDEFRQFMQVI